MIGSLLIPRRIERGNRVSIGLSWIDALDGAIGDDVRIGHLNVLRQIKRLEIGSNAYLLNGNQFFGAKHYDDFPGTLVIGENAGVMSRHFFDVSGEISIGERAVIAGRDTHIWSHTLAASGNLVPTHVRIGAGCYVGARCTLIGCSIPDGWIVGAGSVVVGNFDPEPTRCLIAGNPAKIVKRYGEEEYA